jgi:hypothetical protein
MVKKEFVIEKIKTRGIPFTEYVARTHKYNPETGYVSIYGNRGFGKLKFLKKTKIPEGSKIEKVGTKNWYPLTGKAYIEYKKLNKVM